jgi:hypothetical protein
VGVKACALACATHASSSDSRICTW